MIGNMILTCPHCGYIWEDYVDPPDDFDYITAEIKCTKCLRTFEIYYDERDSNGEDVLDSSFNNLKERVKSIKEFLKTDEGIEFLFEKAFNLSWEEFESGTITYIGEEGTE